MDGEHKTAARQVAEQVMPDSASARLSRIFEVNQRTAQKWLSGQIEPPERVVQWLNATYAALYHDFIDEDGKHGPTLDDQISAVIANFVGGRHNVHPEVIASHLALHYKRLVHREVE